MEKTITLPIDFLQRKQNAITVFIIIILIMFSLLSIGKCNAQDFNARARQFFVMDVVTGGIIGGVGSAFHPKQNEKRSHAFMQGFWKGCVGGSLTFTGKYMIYGVTKNNNLTYAWPAKMVHSVGASFMENAARNAAIYDNFALDYGAVRVDVNYKGKVKVRAMPFAAGGILLHAFYGDDFNLKNTILCGSVYFNMHRDTSLNTAVTYVNSVGVDTDLNHFTVKRNYHGRPEYIRNLYQTSAHEIVHTMQYRELLSSNNIFYKNENKYIFIDASVTQTIAYSFGSVNGYSNNPYELQAECLSSHRSSFLK